MFTGIVTDVGIVRRIEHPNVSHLDIVRLEITTAYETATIAIGASICCSGVCLTVVDRSQDWFAVDVSNETLARTTLGGWRAGRRVNLERSLKAGDEMGGHIVSGHVDGVASIAAIRADGGSQGYAFVLPNHLARFVAVKGSIAVDGVSLTVNEVEGAWFGVNLIPHTLAATSLGDAVSGDTVNVEIDMLARYVARFLETR